MIDTFQISRTVARLPNISELVRVGWEAVRHHPADEATVFFYNAAKDEGKPRLTFSCNRNFMCHEMLAKSADIAAPDKAKGVIRLEVSFSGFITRNGNRRRNSKDGLTKKENKEMFKDNKATLQGGFVNNQNSRGRINHRQFVFNYTQNRNAVQCLKCGSDYMRFAVDGYCQNCQQRVEYILREHPRTARNGGVNSNV